MNSKIIFTTIAFSLIIMSCALPIKSSVNSNYSNNTLIGGCMGTTFGCCEDNVTQCMSHKCSNCFNITSFNNTLIGGCMGTTFGCCEDNVTQCLSHNCSDCFNVSIV